MSPTWIATIDAGVAFWCYASVRPIVRVKIYNLLTFNAMDHSFLLRDQKYLRGCKFSAVSSSLMVMILTLCLIKVLVAG